jgi:hypothetical protein
MKTTEIAKKIDNLFKKHLYGELGDYRIFYNGKAIDVNTSTGRKIMDDKLASEYVDYSNTAGVTVTFDGAIYDLMNYSSDFALVNELTDLLEKYGCWYENGNAWNFSVYEW